ncbi:MAG: lysophospholipid acyltransferase family protein [Actinomycetota bacterium]
MADPSPVPGADRRIPPRTVLRALARLFRLLIAPFVRLEIRGGACATRLKTGVIVANHRSMGDAIVGLVVLHHFGHYPRVLIAREYVEERWTAPLARAIGAIPVDRSADPARALDPAIDAVRGGAPVLVMPEGRLWQGEDPDSLGPAKTGAARLAVGSGTPVVVAALSGTADAWPPGRPFPRIGFRRRTVLVRVADDPFTVPSGDPRAATDAVMEELRAHLVRANRERQALVER